MALAIATVLDGIRVMLGANIPVKLESLPGAGKTSLLTADVEATGGYMDTMVAVNYDPTDFGGIPAPDLATGFYDHLAARRFQRLNEAVATHPLVVWFNDEVNTAPRSVMAALLKAVDEGIIGDFRLDPAIRKVLAVNPAEANGGVDLNPAMANRVSHWPFLFPLREWAAKMRTQDWTGQPIVLCDPAELLVQTQQWGNLVADFAESGMFVEEYPQDMAARSKAWASRRTWTLGAKAMGAADLLGKGAQVRDACLESLVGAKAASAFQDFMDARSQVDPNAVLSDPNGFPWPLADDEVFLMLDRVTKVALSPEQQSGLADPNKVHALTKVLLRCAKEQGRPGVGGGAMRDLAVFLKANRQYIGSDEAEAIKVYEPVIQSLGQAGV